MKVNVKLVCCELRETEEERNRREIKKKSEEKKMVIKMNVIL